MKIIDRYILKEIATAFVGVLLLLTVILSLGKITQSVEMILGRGVDVFDIIKLILILLPASLQFTIPIALLIAVLMGIGRLSSDNELTILKTSGLSFFRVSLPVLGFSVFVVFFAFLTTFLIIPQSSFQAKHLVFEILKKQASLGVEEGRFSDSWKGVLVYVSKIKPFTGEMENIFISDKRMAKEPAIVVAKRAALISDDKKMKVMLHLFNGSLYMADDASSYYRRIDFSSYTVALDVGKKVNEIVKSSTDMTFNELLSNIAQTPDGPKKQEMLIELNKKITIPLSCLGFCLIALPLGIRSQRAAHSRGFVLGFTLALIYTLFNIGGEALAETGKISPAVSAWVPLLAFCSVGGLLYYLAGKELLLPSLSFNFSTKIFKNHK